MILKRFKDFLTPHLISYAADTNKQDINQNVSGESLPSFLWMIHYGSLHSKRDAFRHGATPATIDEIMTFSPIDLLPYSVYAIR